jgi:hypothetical protein
MAAVGLALRRRVGAWASWLFLLLATGLVIRCCASPPWWTHPDFLSGLDEAVGLVASTLLIALTVHQFGPRGPWFPIPLALASLLGLLAQWGNARYRPSTTATTFFLAFCALWLIGLVTRDWLHHRSRTGQGAE